MESDERVLEQSSTHDAIPSEKSNLETLQDPFDFDTDTDKHQGDIFANSGADHVAASMTPADEEAMFEERLPLMASMSHGEESEAHKI